MHWRWKKLSSSDVECLESSIMNRCVGFVGLFSQEDHSLFKDFCTLMFVSIGLEASIICPRVCSHSSRVGPKEIFGLITMSPSMRAIILKSKRLQINQKAHNCCFTFPIMKGNYVSFLESGFLISLKHGDVVSSKLICHLYKMLCQLMHPFNYLLGMEKNSRKRFYLDSKLWTGRNSIRI